MPIYEYVCRQCEERFEAIVHSASEATCPGCGATRLDRQLSVFAVGSGGSTRSDRPAPAPCGSCGDPRGPGSCALD